MKWWVKSMKKFVGFWIILNTYLFKFLQLLAVYPFLFLIFVGIPVGNIISAGELKMLVINTGIKKYKSVIKKKKKLDQIVLLGKSKLDNIEALISNTEKLMKIKGD